MNRKLRAVFAIPIVALCFPGSALACSSCGCTINSDWSSEGYAVGSGVRIDLRFDYFNQSDLRSGSDSVDRSTLEVPNDEEIQRTTVNRNTTLGIDYAPSRAWGFNVQLPYFDRFHSTLAEGDSDLSYSHTTGIGDARVTARYQGFSSDAGIGIMFGLKLPTGRTDATFYAGPEAGEVIDRGLQPGTGTTDALIGLYRSGGFGQAFGYFAQALLQQPLNSDGGFKPGAGVNINLGVRYTALQTIKPQLQLNIRSERRESGINADIDNSGATLAYLSPGLDFHWNRHWDGFVFMQFPVYQHVNGLQLEPSRFFSIGLKYRL